MPEGRSAEPVPLPARPGPRSGDETHLQRSPILPRSALAAAALGPLHLRGCIVVVAGRQRPPSSEGSSSKTWRKKEQGAWRERTRGQTAPAGRGAARNDPSAVIFHPSGGRWYTKTTIGK